MVPAAPCDEARASYARIPVRSPGSTSHVRLQSQRYRPGGPRAPTVSRRAQTPAAAADVDSPRPLLLDHPPASVAPMGGRAAHRETGDRGPVASRRLSPLLALAIPTARGPAADQRGDADPDPSLGSGECGLGGAPDPRRTLEARLRRLRTQRRPVSTTRSTPRRSRQPLVGLPRQPPRGDRGLRFFPGPPIALPAALLLLHHRTPSPHDSACQRDSRADARLGGATTAR